MIQQSIFLLNYICTTYYILHTYYCMFLYYGSFYTTIHYNEVKLGKMHRILHNAPKCTALLLRLSIPVLFTLCERAQAEAPPSCPEKIHFSYTKRYTTVISPLHCNEVKFGEVHCILHNIALHCFVLQLIFSSAFHFM